MRWVATAATGLCLMLLAGASLVNPSQAAEPSQERVFAQEVWLRVLPAQANAGCVSNGVYSLSPKAGKPLAAIGVSDNTIGVSDNGV